MRGEKLDAVFCDCTSLYFESFKQSCKFNQAQIILSILVPKQGLPAGYQICSGNIFEGNTLEDSVKLIKEKYKIRK
ncbi:MAG: hypothetical protein L3J56_04660 [Bacteroidales bacterium]|nr:hypothetical protein [Bacteroidales bacterium]